MPSFSQSDILIPYRSGVHWGLADTNLNVVVKPAYDSFLSSSNIYPGYYVVIKDGMQGIITREKEIVPCSAERMFMQDGMIFATYKKANNKGSEYLIYTLDGTQLFPYKVNWFRPLKFLYTFRVKRPYVYKVETDDKESVILLDSSRSRITSWLLKDNDDIYYTELDGKEILKTKKDGKKYFYEIVNIDLDHVEVKEITERQLEIMATSDMYVDYDDEMIMEAEDEVMEDYNGRKDHVEIVDVVVSKKKFLFTETFLTNRSNYRYSKVKKLRVDSLRTGELPTKKVEKVDYIRGFDDSLSQYYQVKVEIDYYGNGRKRSTFIARNSSSYLRFNVKGKWGFATEFITKEATYDTLVGYAAIGGRLPYFLVGERSENGKMQLGILSADGEILVPMSQDKIEPYFMKPYYEGRESNLVGYILSKDGTQSFMDLSRKGIFYEGFEQLIPYPDYTASFIIKDHGKYGFINRWKYIAPMFDDIPLGTAYYSDLKLITIYDEKTLEFKGYAMYSGKLFYKD